MTNNVKTLTLGALCNLLAEQKRTLIICHARPDGDAIGSAFALKEILRQTGSEAYCICESEVPKRLKFLTSEIQSSSLITAIPENFIPERVITVDTASLSQMGKLENFFKDSVDIMIDHHRVGEPYADHYIDATAAATGEIIYRIADALLSAKGKPIPLAVCKCLYAAISSDTGCFKYSNVTPSTHIVAASLIKNGVDGAEINRLLFDTKSPARLHAEKVGLDNIKLCFDGRVALVALDCDALEALAVDPEEYDAFIDAARLVEGAEVAVSVRRTSPDEAFRVSMRSMSNADVSEICAAFGGGGHVKAAGCSIEASSVEEAVEKVLREVAERL